MEKEFKILSIDGGGIKGLYPAKILEHFEKVNECNIHEYFDMICGTSTGGLVALGLGKGIKAKELAEIYSLKGKKIFKNTNLKFIDFAYRTIFRQVFFRGKYSNKNLKKIAVEKFGETTMGNSKCLLNIPSYNLTIGMPRMFKYPHKEGELYKDRDILMSDVALATSAAPTYFPIHEINNALYVDGGVWANNPTLCGLIEALQYFVNENTDYDSIRILSLPTVSMPSGWSPKKNKRKAFLSWNNKLFSTSLDGQSYNTDYFIKELIKHTKVNIKYTRLPQPKLSCKQQKYIDMDKASKKAIKILEAFGDQDGAYYSLQPEIKAFFKNKKTYII